MASAIEITDLKKYFGKKHAVDGISMSIEPGEIFGFLGPNGAGKTTAIRCMMGFNRPTGGSISILGHDMATDSVTAKKSMGYLPGNVKLYDAWTGWDHLRLYESVRGKSKNLSDLLERLDFDPTAKFRQLSSGNKQKLGLILALMNEPRVLVMDEPTVGLDPLLQNTIYEILTEYRDGGTTIFVSSHNLPEVERLCDRVGVIKDGKLIAVENIRELAGKKLHRMEVRFADEFEKSEFEVPGVDRVEEISGGLLVTVSGDINPILSKVTAHELIDFEFSHANLEEIFLKFYERGDQ